MAVKKAARKAASKKSAGRPTIWTPRLEDKVIQAIAETGSQTEAAKRCGIHRRRIDERVADDVNFRSRIARAREMGYAARAEKAVQAAKTARDASKGRLAFDAERWLLSKLAPKQYGDKVAMEHAGPGGGPIQVIDYSKVSDDDLERLESIFSRIAGAGAGAATDPDGAGTPPGSE